MRLSLGERGEGSVALQTESPWRFFSMFTRTRIRSGFGIFGAGLPETSPLQFLCRVYFFSASFSTRRHICFLHFLGGLVSARMIVRIRRFFVLRKRILLQFIHDELHGFFQLRIVAATDGMRVEIDFHIGSDAVVFHVPVAVRAPEGHARGGDEAAVYELWIVVDAGKSAPGALAPQRADLGPPERPS